MRMTDDSTSLPARPDEGRVQPRIAFAIWSIPALLSTFETVMFSAMAKHPIPVWKAFASEAPQWYCWALLTPVIAGMGERFPLRRPFKARNFLANLGASLLASLFTAFMQALVNSALRPSKRTIPQSTVSWFLSGLPATTLAYFAILAVAMALASNARLRERERRAAQLEAELREAQLGALRMQLQPHFLFNSLNAIMALVRDRETERAIHALSLLSDILRTAVNAGDANETTLAQEIEFVTRYLDIERVRFGERLAVDISAPDELLTARVPIFILQPFVENALKHGILRERAGNRITITARKEGGSLHLRVEDDGRGLAAATGEPGVGIRNARSRLERMYGSASALTIGAGASGRGVCVDISLPYAS